MIGKQLPGEAASFRLLALEKCQSTNAEAMRHAGDDENDRLWVTAAEQTSGKGSRGRDWTSLEGNLFASLLLRDPAMAKHLPELTFVAAVALRNAILKLCGDETNVCVKWPNDLLLNGKKCSGILLESKLEQNTTWVVVGIGVNCKCHPQQALQHATSLAAEGFDIVADGVFSALAIEMAKTLRIWRGGEGFSQIRKEWLAAATGIGSDVVVRIPGKPDLCGIFASVDPAGYMLLETSDKQIVRVSAADIFFL